MPFWKKYVKKVNPKCKFTLEVAGVEWKLVVSTIGGRIRASGVRTEFVKENGLTVGNVLKFECLWFGTQPCHSIEDHVQQGALWFYSKIKPVSIEPIVLEKPANDVDQTVLEQAADHPEIKEEKETVKATDDDRVNPAAADGVKIDPAAAKAERELSASQKGLCDACLDLAEKWLTFKIQNATPLAGLVVSIAGIATVTFGATLVRCYKNS